MSDSNVSDQEVVATITMANPSYEEWISIKPKLTQLYCIDRRTLDQVRQQLKEENNFSARLGNWFLAKLMTDTNTPSIHAFKRKIKLWDLRRSYTSEEKDLLCKTSIEAFGQTSDPPPELVRWKPIDQSKLQRHKATRRRALAHLAVHATGSITAPVPATADPSQIALRATQDLWLHQVGSALANDWHTGCCDMRLVADLTDIAIYLSLPTGLSLAQSALLRFCQSFNSIFIDQPLSVLLAVFELVANPRWHHHPQTQANLFRAIRKKVLTCERINPFLYHIFNTIQSPDSLRLIMPRMLSIQVQKLLSNYAAHTDHLLGILTDAIVDLIHCRETSEALKLASAVPQTTKLSHMKQCEAQLLISRCQLEVGTYQEAMLSGEKALQDCEPFIVLHNKSYAYTYINTCDVLARCSDALADLPSIVAYRTRAHATALDIFGTQASNTLYHQAQLEKAIAQLGEQRRPQAYAPG